MMANSAPQKAQSEDASVHEVLVTEIVERWAPVLAPKTWDQRLESLNEIHNYLVGEFPTFAEFCDIFPRFISALIEELGNGPVTSLAQAHIYANSQNPEHRQTAGAWLKNNQR